MWTGRAAQGRGLVDVLGGLHEAVELVKQAAGIAPDERVMLLEVSRARTSPLALLGERVGQQQRAVYSRGRGLMSWLLGQCRVTDHLPVEDDRQRGLLCL